jgi:hypothetical protein
MIFLISVHLQNLFLNTQDDWQFFFFSVLTPALNGVFSTFIEMKGLKAKAPERKKKKKDQNGF